MQVIIMGSAAGGGFPQWNCSCRNCRALRQGRFPGKARTQLGLAISDKGETWFLVNASPDLRGQIEATEALHPRQMVRHSPIAGVLLTGADIDQVMGLLVLREFQHFAIYATSSVCRILREDNSLFGALNRVSRQAAWAEIVPGRSFVLGAAEDANGGIECLPLALEAECPSYITPERSRQLGPDLLSLALIMSGKGGGRLAYCPVVSRVDSDLLDQLESVDLVLFDGTFWSDDELSQLGVELPPMRGMGHMPISGPDGSLQALARLDRPRKVYIHVNNTNPILDLSSREYRQVRDAGWEVAEDGWQLEL